MGKEKIIGHTASILATILMFFNTLFSFYHSITLMLITFNLVAL